jgi:hypothetical protein
MLPENLEEIGKSHDLLKYRRAFSSIRDLMLLAFAYSICDFSLKNVAAWAIDTHVAKKKVSDVAVLKQLQHMTDFMQTLLTMVIQRYAPVAWSGEYRLVLVDGTSFGRIGSKGVDWRVNLAYASNPVGIVDITVTEGTASEEPALKGVGKGDLLIGDRHYCTNARIRRMLSTNAAILVRSTRIRSVLWKGATLNPLKITQQHWLLPGQTLDLDVVIPSSQKNEREIPLRLVVIQKTKEATQRSIKKLRTNKIKKNRESESPEAIEAAGYLFLLTSLSREEATTEQISQAYRWRWQIELCFKQWKSLMHLDDLRARDKLANVYIRTKLLCAILQNAVLRSTAFSPWGSYNTIGAGTLRTAARRPHRKSASTGQ